MFLHPILCSFLGGSNFKKCFQQSTTLLYGRFRRSQQCCVQRMCVQQYVCVYAKITLCVHTAVRPRNIPRNINRMMTGCLKKNLNAPRPLLLGCDQFIINTVRSTFSKYQVSYFQRTQRSTLCCAAGANRSKKSRGSTTPYALMLVMLRIMPIFRRALPLFRYAFPHAVYAQTSQKKCSPNG